MHQVAARHVRFNDSSSLTHPARVALAHCGPVHDSGKACGHRGCWVGSDDAVCQALSTCCINSMKVILRTEVTRSTHTRIANTYPVAKSPQSVPFCCFSTLFCRELNFATDAPCQSFLRSSVGCAHESYTRTLLDAGQFSCIGHSKPMVCHFLLLLPSPLDFTQRVS